MNKELLRPLGRSGLQLSPIGLGTWQFSGGKGLVGGYWKALDKATTCAIVEKAIAGGINWFDTAEAYGKGESECNLSKALKALQIAPGQVHVATKWWPVLRTAKHLKNSIDERQQCLGGYPIAHYIVHQPLSFSSVEKQMHAMADLMDAGEIQSVGVSNFSAKAMRKSHEVLKSRGYFLAANQCRYSLAYRNIEHNDILACAKELGISIIAWSPLEQGLLTGRFHQQGSQGELGFFRRQMLNDKRIAKTAELIEALNVLAQKYQVTASQIALNFLIHRHGKTVFAIPGASKISQLEQNVGAMRFQLTESELEDLAAIRC